MNVPSWYELLLLALAAFRTWRLIARDTILDRPREWILAQPARRWRDHLETWLECMWCQGFWQSLAWWGAWQVWPRATLVAAAPWAISALLALAAKNLDD